MAGGAASETIFFIGAVIVATGLVAALSGIATELSTGVRDRGNSLSNQLQTDIEIINDPLNVSVSPLKIYVKNTGSTSLHTNIVDIIVDGQVSSNRGMDVVNSTNDAVWKSSEVLQITVNDLSPGSGDHRVRVVTQYGIDDELEFNVP